MGSVLGLRPLPVESHYDGTSMDLKIMVLRCSLDFFNVFYTGCTSYPVSQYFWTLRWYLLPFVDNHLPLRFFEISIAPQQGQLE